jgi:bifunctional DNA-binding transcriptional regulator/antitoxin component of YhaV-PrlF toxin-antitoxin module
MNPTSSLTNGRAVIPFALREQLGFKDGDQLVWAVRDDELVVTTRRAQQRRAQAAGQKIIPATVLLVDELQAQRQAEQAQEDKR